MKTITETVMPPPAVTRTVYVCDVPGCPYRTLHADRAERHPGFHVATRREVQGESFLFFPDRAAIAAYTGAWDYNGSEGARAGAVAVAVRYYWGGAGWYRCVIDREDEPRLVAVRALRTEAAEALSEAQRTIDSLDGIINTLEGPTP